MWRVEYGYFSRRVILSYSHCLNSTAYLIGLTHFEIKAARRSQLSLGYEARTEYLDVCAQFAGVISVFAS